MFIVGLTGGIGSGKTTVARLFARLGVEVIDADEVAHALVKPGQAALTEICDYFGKTILNNDGLLDRRQLRDIVFADAHKRLALETILHPKIRQQMLAMAEAADTPYVMLVIPLLVDTGNWHFIDRVVVVDCDDELQIERVMQRDKQSRDQVIAVMNAQISRAKRLATADDIIYNHIDVENLDTTVLTLHQQYLSFTQKR